jgi:hypothetical protein
MTEFFDTPNFEYSDGANDLVDAFTGLDVASSPDGFVGDVENLAKDAGGDLEVAGQGLVTATADGIKDAGIDGLKGLESFGSDISDGHVVEATEDLVGGALNVVGDLAGGAVIGLNDALMGAGAAVVATGVDGVEAVGEGLYDAGEAVAAGLDDAGEAVVSGIGDAAGAVEDLIDDIGDLF